MSDIKQDNKTAYPLAVANLQRAIEFGDNRIIIDCTCTFADVALFSCDVTKMREAKRSLERALEIAEAIGDKNCFQVRMRLSMYSKVE